MPALISNNPPISRVRLAVGILLLAVWGYLFRDTLVSLYDLAIHDDGHSHLLALPFIAAFFLFLDRKKIFSSNRSNPAFQAVLVALFSTLGAGLFLLTRPPIGKSLNFDVRSLSTASAVLLLFAVLLWVFKGINLSAAFFPGLLLLLMVPIPTGWRENIVTFLVKGTAEFTGILFHLIGTTFFREGSIFLLPGLTIQIADVCSGIRSSIGLLITVLIAGHLFYEKAWTKIALVILVLPLVLIKNAMRVVGLTLLSLYVDPVFLHSSLHHKYGGTVFFGLTLVLFLFPILLILRKLEKSKGNRKDLKISGV